MIADLREASRKILPFPLAYECHQVVPLKALGEVGLIKSLLAVGQVLEAESLWQRALCTLEQVPGSQHPDAAETIHDRVCL